jgi:hypothetical protein
LAFPTAEPIELTPELTPEPTELAPDSIELPTDSTESLTDCLTPLALFLLGLRPELLRLVDLALERDDVLERLEAGRFAVERLPVAREPVVDARPFVERLRVALGALPFVLPLDLVRLARVPFRAGVFLLGDVLV